MQTASVVPGLLPAWAGGRLRRAGATPARRIMPAPMAPTIDNPPDLPSAPQLAAWLAAVAEHHDREAFAALFRHLAPRVKGFLQRCGARPDEAEDLAQEALVVLWRRAGTFDRRQAAVTTWLFAISRNLLVDLRRRQSARARGLEGLVPGEAADALPVAGPLPDELAQGEQGGQALRAALARLPEGQWRVLQMSYFDDQPHSAIASRLGVPLGTVKSRIRLAVAQLRRLLGEDEA